MKYLKWTLAVVGVLGAAVGGWFLFESWIGIGKMMAVAVSNRSAEFPSPMNNVLLTAALFAAGFFLLGLAIGLPRRSANSVRREIAQQLADAPVAAEPDEEPGQAAH